jgi:hypothetical protein
LADGIDNRCDNENGNDQNSGMREPLESIRPRRDPEISLRDGSQNQTDEQRRPLPIELDHEPSERAEKQHDDHVTETVLDRESAKVNEHEEKGDE